MKDKMDDSLFEDVEYKEMDDSLFEDVEFSQDESSPIESSLKGAAVGAGLGKVLKESPKVIRPAAGFVGETLKLDDLATAYNLRSEGIPVTGDKARTLVSKDAREKAQEMSDLVEDQKRTAGKKIGKITDLADTKVPAKNINDRINNIKKLLKDVGSTEEAQKTKKELEKSLNKLQKQEESVKVSRKGSVTKTGQEDAIEKLRKKLAKQSSIAEELGESKRFGDIKIEDDLVKALDIDEGKVITQPIKAGEFTPINIEKQVKTYTDKMSTKELQNLKKDLDSIIKTADPSTPAYKVANQAKKEIQSSILENVEKGLGTKGKDILSSANEEFSQASKIQRQYKELADKTDDAKYSLARNIKNLESSSEAGVENLDKLRNELSRLKNQPKASKLLEGMQEISTRNKLAREIPSYTLANLLTKASAVGGETAGAIAEPFKNVSRATGLSDVLDTVGDAASKASKPIKQVGGKLLDKAPIIGGIAGLLMSYQEAVAAGADPTEAAQSAIAQEGLESIPVAGQMLPASSGPQNRKSTEYKIEQGKKVTPEEYAEYLGKLMPQIEALQNSNNEGHKQLATQAKALVEAETPADRARELFRLNQQPAFKRLIKDSVVGNSEKMLSEQPEEISPLEEILEGNQDVSRDPSSTDNILDSLHQGFRRTEGTGDLTGAAETGDLGVTASAIKATGMEDAYKNAKSIEEKQEIDRQVSRKYLELLQSKMPSHWKEAPSEVQKALLDTTYNVGESVFNYTNLNNSIKNKDFQRVATNLLDVINIGGKGSKGLAKRRAEAYNMIARGSGFPEIDSVVLDSGEIKYLGEDGSTIFSIIPKKGIHKDSTDGVEKVPRDIERNPSSIIEPEMTENMNQMTDEQINNIKNQLSRVMRLRGSGDLDPVNQIEDTLEGVDKLPIAEEDKQELADKIMSAETFVDEQRIGSMLDRLSKFN